MELVGYNQKFEDPGDGSRPYLIRPERIPGKAPYGAEYDDKDKLKPLRNHPAQVLHIPEILTIWGANIEGSVVQYYPQVVRYLMSYMMKDEPNSNR